MQDRTLVVRPGLEVRYQVMGEDPRAPALVLANGLGGRFYAWSPLLRRFCGRYRIITWDYRGLFGSTRPERSKELSVPHHANDAVRILDREQVDRATFVGWSMGVQVSLETALESPARVERMVLLNGTYGQVFQTGLQPLVRMPGIPRALHQVVERLSRKNPRVSRAVQGLIRNRLHVSLVAALLVRWRRDPLVGELYRQYVDDVFGPSFPNYLRLFQELDAHSVYHLLPEVTQPTLVVSGGLDWLTPASLSNEMARRIPGSDHLHLRLASHFALIEYPARVLDRMEAFLR